MQTLFKKILSTFAIVLSLVLSPSLASAHEVYVLSPEHIARDIAVKSPNPFSIVATNQMQFALWGFICILVVVLVLIFSLTKKIEKFADPFLFRIKKYAPFVARITLGICLMFSAQNGALFGPELPFLPFAGDYTHLLTTILYTIGIALTIGLFTRACSFVALIVYGLAGLHYGVYMIMYSNYLGEILINLILGGGFLSVDTKFFKCKSSLDKVFAVYEKYSFVILRVLYGISIVFASLYAKFIHSALAFDTVNEYHLTNYFHFVPLFIVLGAFIVESIIGFFFIVGFEIRFTIIVFWTFLALSLAYFGEAVWPHMLLIGVNLALFMHGYDEYTIEKKLFMRKSKLEAVL